VAFAHVLLAGNAQTLVNLMVPGYETTFSTWPRQRKTEELGALATSAMETFSRIFSTI